MYLRSCIGLVLIGGTMFSLGLPYFVSHWGRPQYAYCCAVNPFAKPSMEWILKNNGAFQYFTPYGLLFLCVAAIMLFLHKAQKAEMVGH